MNVLIAVNAYIKNRSQIMQAERISEELTKAGADAEIKKNFALAEICGGKVAPSEYDFCIFLDKDKVAARLLEKSGLRLFNRSRAMETCDDKMLTSIALSDCGIDMPDCIYAPLCYHEDSLINAEYLLDTEEKLKYPLVAKMNYGSLGAGVELIENRSELLEYEKEHMLVPHFYQRFIDCGGGEDVRVIVVGGKYLCAMKRTNANDFRSNIELGGRGQICVPDDELIRLCEKVANVLDLDYCGVDVLTDKEGKRYICEVNSNAFFAAAEEVCGVNVAKAYAEHAIKSYTENK